MTAKDRPASAGEGRITARPPAEVVLVSVPPMSMESPPLGLACLVGHLRQHGVSCAILDANARLFHEREDLRHFWRMEESSRWLLPGPRRELFSSLAGELGRVVEEILEREPALVGLSVFGTMQYAAMALVDRLRAAGFVGTILIGGPATSTASERQVFFVERVGVDGLVVGEGEETLLEVVRRVRAGRSLAGVAGMVASADEELIRRPPIANLDSLPFPDFTDFDGAGYLSPMLPVQGSRGCIRRCVFCENWVHWGRYRAKSPARFLEELRHHMRSTGSREFSWVDTAVNADPRALAALCELLERAALDCRWSAMFLARKDTRPELLQALRRAGCFRLEIGLESGSDRVLRLMRKGSTARSSADTLRWCHEAGIDTVIFLQVGFPGETEEDFQQTLDLLRRNHDSIDLVRSVNGTTLQFSAELMRRPADFGIELPPDSHSWGYEWIGPHGNTREERARRIGEVVRLLDELGIPHELKATVDEYG